MSSCTVCKANCHMLILDFGKALSYHSCSLHPLLNLFGGGFYPGGEHVLLCGYRDSSHSQQGCSGTC